MNYLHFLFKSYFTFIVLFFIGRLIMFGWNFHRLADLSWGQRLLAFVHGGRMDTIATCAILAIPALLLALTPHSWAGGLAKVVSVYLMAWLLLFVFMECATFPFFAQYDVRPNYLFVEYLVYPKEVFSLMMKKQKADLFGALVLMALLVYFAQKTRWFDPVATWETPWGIRLLLLIPVALLLFIGIRSSFGHRPANLSDALYSPNRIANEIAKNSTHSVVLAYAYSTDDDKIINKYGKMPIDEAYNRTAQILNLPYDPQKNFYRLEPTHFKSARPKNLVIFVQESLGAQFVGFSGGEPDLTPNLNRLGKQGIAFTDLYSNGTRSIRGLAGMTAGYLAIPGEGVLKRNKSQKDFFTIAQLLKPLGYRTSFIYGGEARFDNMKPWYLGNGFDTVIEQKDFPKPSFVSTWGVSDEDLVIKANDTFKTYAAAGQPFATVMFSTSNHEPFELPDGKIDFVSGEPKQSVRNAVRYADYAIGKFFELAKKESYYKDTVFVVVADHNIRVYGDDAVPVNMFHIPAVIIADGQPPQSYDKIATQPDVLATALDLMGVNLAHPVLGHSIFSDKKTDVSLMQFNDIYALRKGNTVAVISPGKPAQTYTYAQQRLHPTAHNPELEADALAIITVLDDMYQKHAYKTYP